MGPSEQPSRWITELFFRMESDGHFLLCNRMSSLVGLVDIEVRVRVSYEQDSMPTKYKMSVKTQQFIT